MYGSPNIESELEVPGSQTLRRWSILTKKIIKNESFNSTGIQDCNYIASNQTTPTDISFLKPLSEIQVSSPYKTPTKLPNTISPHKTNHNNLSVLNKIQNDSFESDSTNISNSPYHQQLFFEQEQESNITRSRRTSRTPIKSYKEPSLNTKVRKGHKFF